MMLTTGIVAGGLFQSGDAAGNDDVTDEKLLEELEGIEDSQDLSEVVREAEGHEANEEVEAVVDVLSELASVETDDLDVDVDVNARRVTVRSDAIDTSIEDLVGVTACAIGLDQPEAPIGLTIDGSAGTLTADMDGNGTNTVENTEDADTSRTIHRNPAQQKVADCTGH